MYHHLKGKVEAFPTSIALSASLVGFDLFLFRNPFHIKYYPFKLYC